jgi:uncharacterized protein YebE (UPF0316 family)
MTDVELFHAIQLGTLIFFARIADVTLGTMRIVYISRGRKNLAPLLGFFEVIVWLFFLPIVVANLGDPSYYMFFAAGFAAGTFVGLRVEERLALGTRIVRIVTKTDAGELISALRAAGHGITSIDTHGSQGKVHVLFSLVERKNIEDFIGMVRR